MLKILIADDEMWIRENLKIAIDWNKYGFSIAGEAEDADEAYELYKKLMPDILITDVRMGDTNGLDLLRKIRAENSHIELIVLSVYEQFDYAKRAMESDTYSYIVKPIDDRELLKIILSLKEKILKSRVVEKKLNILDEQFDDIKLSFFTKLCTGKISDFSHVRSTLADYGINFPKRFYYLALAAADKAETPEHLKVLGECALQHKALRPYPVEVFSLENGMYVFLISAEKNLEIQFTPAFMLRSFETLQNEFARKTSATLSIGLSEMHEQLTQLSAAYSEAAEALEEHSISGNESRVFHGDLAGSIVPVKKPDVHKITKYIVKGDCRSAQAVFDAFFDVSRSTGRISFKNFQNIIAETVVIVLHAVFKNNTDIYKIFGGDFQPLSAITQCTTVDEIKKLVTDFLSRISLVSTSKYSSRPDIQYAIAIIRQNYSSQLTLEQVANDIHMSVFHFARLFKQETNMTFVDYLTNYRLNIASYLLTEGRYKVYEIASTVGYSDTDYFIKLFKKKFGCTPKRYAEKE